MTAGLIGPHASLRVWRKSLKSGSPCESYVSTEDPPNTAYLRTEAVKRV
jgi:hypothetical protein